MEAVGHRKLGYFLCGYVHVHEYVCVYMYIYMQQHHAIQSAATTVPTVVHREVGYFHIYHMKVDVCVYTHTYIYTYTSTPGA